MNITDRMKRSLKRLGIKCVRVYPHGGICYEPAGWSVELLDTRQVAAMAAAIMASMPSGSRGVSLTRQSDGKWRMEPISNDGKVDEPCPYDSPMDALIAWLESLPDPGPERGTFEWVAERIGDADVVRAEDEVLVVTRRDGRYHAFSDTHDNLHAVGPMLGAIAARGVGVIARYSTNMTQWCVGFGSSQSVYAYTLWDAFVGALDAATKGGPLFAEDEGVQSSPFAKGLKGGLRRLPEEEGE